MSELRARGVVRSSNNPVADYAEWLAAQALGLTLEGKSHAGFDGVGSDGFKYQVKGRRRTPQNTSVQLGQIRGLDERRFDYLVGIIFRPDFSVEYEAQVPHAVVVERSKFNAHTNASIFHLRPDVFDDHRVRDISAIVQEAASIGLSPSDGG